MGQPWNRYDRPPKGDGSEGFYIGIQVLISFLKKSIQIVLFNILFHIWKLSRNDGGKLQNIFRSHFDLETTLKSPILDLKTEHSMLQPPETFSVPP